MSYAIDVNVFLYASDASSVHHQRAVDFLQACGASPEILCIAWPTIMGYLRISTHPAIFGSPLTPGEAVRNMDAFLRLPQVQVIAEEDGFWGIFGQVTQGMAVRGNLVPDAHLAALLRQHGVTTIYTNDADFRRFTFLNVRNPLQ